MSSEAEAVSSMPYGWDFEAHYPMYILGISSSIIICVILKNGLDVTIGTMSIKLYDNDNEYRLYSDYQQKSFVIFFLPVLT